MKTSLTLFVKVFSIFVIITYATSIGFVFAQNSEHIVNHVITQKKVVALTFDADMTPRMLHMLKKKKVTTWYNKDVIDTLEKENVPATLFLTGMWVQTYPDITKQLSENPLFEIGNHSYSHPAFGPLCYRLATTSESNYMYQMTKTEEVLSQHTTHHSMFFRFPGLCYDSVALKDALDLGYTIIGGDVRGDDGFQKDSQTIVSQVVSHVTSGSIVILHMMGGPNAPQTGNALPVIIEKLKQEGYTFVTVSELLKS
jgi:peptidoglycan/xylan/chitin deacetylase (PgdA/CDA1 family)